MPPPAGGSPDQGMRDLFGDLLERQRMYSPRKHITRGQFETVNDLLGGILAFEEDKAKASSSSSSRTPHQPQPPS